MLSQVKPRYSSRRQMKRAFREGHGVYEDGQSSFSMNCQQARDRGRRPLTEAVKLVRQACSALRVKVTLKDAKQALLKTHDGEWHHTSKYGNRTAYYDPQPAVQLLTQGRLAL